MEFRPFAHWLTDTDGRKAEGSTLAALARVGTDLIAALGEPDMAQRLCARVAEALACECSYTLLEDKPRRSFKVVAIHGLSAEAQEELRAIEVPARALANAVRALHRRDVVQSRVPRRPGPWSALAVRYGLTRILYVALRRGDRIIGLQGAAFRGSTRPFSAHQLRIVRPMADLASLALEDVRLIERLRCAENVKADFVATMSHELRTPLNIIIGYGDLLLDGSLGPLTDLQQKALHHIATSSQRLLEMINSVLDVNRLEKGHAPLCLTPVDLVGTIRSLVDELRRGIEKAGVMIAFEAERGLSPVHTDELKLRVLLKHLVDNALKFTERGSVRIVARSWNGGAEITVHDTGIGIAPAIRPFIFEPFRQGDSSSTRRHEGVGLGLYFVRRLVKLLRGTIVVESEEGCGSSFRVWLPSHVEHGK